jgi:polyisoprenoid-binding protein YceI
VEKYPQIEFTSTEVRDFDGETFTPGRRADPAWRRQDRPAGDRVPRRRRRPIRRRATGFSATTTIRRAGFGVDIPLGSGAGNVVVADTIEIEFTASGSDLR